MSADTKLHDLWSTMLFRFVYSWASALLYRTLQDFNQIKEYMTAGSTDPPEKQAVKEKLTVR